MFTIFTPYPTAWAVRALFGSTSYTNHELLEETMPNITVLEDIKYPLKHKKNTLDIIYPENQATPLPVIFWVYGGAFVAGDKDDVTNYMIMLANEGYVIVNINYKLAPSAKYPTQLTQVGEAYSYIDNSDDYPFIDKDQIYFGGDSAGAHIVAQFITIQTNPDYVMLLNESKETKDIKKIVDKEITGAILFAGPYDFKELSNLVKKRVVRDENQLLSSIVSFVAKRIGFGYLGTMNWKNNDKFDGLNVVDYVNNNFPSTFITDGRIISFEAHSKKLEQKLSEYNVGVHSVYYDYDLMHEYQMNLGTISDDNNNYAQLTFNELITFLNAS